MATPGENPAAGREPGGVSVGGGTENLRKVTVVGTPESQWKAQYLIFEKLREEGFNQGMEDVKLTVEIMVPSSQVRKKIDIIFAHVRETSIVKEKISCHLRFILRFPLLSSDH